MLAVLKISSHLKKNVFVLEIV